MLLVDWQVYILITVFISSFITVLTKLFLTSHKGNSVLFAIYLQFVTSFFVLFFVIFLNKFDLVFIKEFWPNILILSFLNGIATILIFTALPNIHISKFVVIFALRVLVTFFASYILINERITFINALGALLVLFSIVFVNFDISKHKNNSNKLLSSLKNTLFVLLASVLVGIAVVNDKFVATNTNPYFYTFLAYFSPGVIMCLFYFKSLLKNFKKDLFKINYTFNVLLISILTTFASLSYFTAIYVGTSITKVTTFNLSSVILTVILSFIFLKEKDHMYKKLFSSIICFLGLILLS